MNISPYNRYSVTDEIRTQKAQGENAIMEQKKFIVEQIELLQAERDNLGSSEKDELKFEQLSNEIDKLLLKFKKIATSTEYSALVLVL